MDDKKHKEQKIENEEKSSVIIPFPDAEELKSSLEKLRTEISMLVLERDELVFVECKNIEMAYMLSIGGLEYKAYEIECRILRLKRKAEMIQSKKNRQEKIEISKIEKLIDSEFAQYQANLEEQIEKMNAAIKWSRSEALSDEEIKEVKKLYRAIVKSLHPDLNPSLSEAKLQLFYNSVIAYENGDIGELRFISILINESAPKVENTDVTSHMVKEKERLLKIVESIKENIEKIKSEYPYTLKSLLESPQKTQQRKDEVQSIIDELNETLELYKFKVENMLR